MTRGLTPDFETAINQPVVRWLMFVEMDFASGFVRCSNATHNILWNSVTWLGVGELGGIDAIQENTELGARGMRVTLSGVDNSLAATALGEHYQNRPIRIYGVPLDDQQRMVLEPMQLWSGHMDVMTIALDRDATITVTAENQLAALLVPRERHYNDPDQQAEYPGDLGLGFVAELAVTQLSWGGTTPFYSTPVKNPFSNLEIRSLNWGN